MTFQPVLTIVVCTFNRDYLLRNCLRSLASQTLDDDLFEVVVVDNNSTDNTQTVLKEFAARYPIFRPFLETRQGLSHARNHGWREARGEYVAYIDDDAKAFPNWCEHILSVFANHPQAVVVGGQILPWYEVTPPEWFTDEFEIRSKGGMARFLTGENASFGFSGSNMIFCKRILPEFNGFSADFGMSADLMRLGEEIELFKRIYQKYPYFYYDPELKVSHWVPSRNMTAVYRWKRSFCSARDSTRVYKDRANIKVFIALIFYILVTPYVLLRSVLNFKRGLVIHGQKIADYLGVLFA